MGHNRKIPRISTAIRANRRVKCSTSDPTGAPPPPTNSPANATLTAPARARATKQETTPHPSPSPALHLSPPEPRPRHTPPKRGRDDAEPHALHPTTATAASGRANGKPPHRRGVAKGNSRNAQRRRGGSSKQGRLHHPHRRCIGVHAPAIAETIRFLSPARVFRCASLCPPREGRIRLRASGSCCVAPPSPF